MTKLHSQIKSLLLPSMLAITAAERNKQAKPEKKEKSKFHDEAKIREAIKWFKNNSSSTYINAWRDMMLGITGIDITPLMDVETEKNKFTCAPLTVVKLGANVSGHKHALNTPVIVLHGMKRHTLHNDGSSGVQFNYNSRNDQPTICSDLEVEQCLDNLTKSQLTFILNSDLFAPALSPLFEEEEKSETAKV